VVSLLGASLLAFEVSQLAAPELLHLTRTAMLKTWERRGYAAAFVAIPLLDLADDQISNHILSQDYADGAPGQIARLTDIHAHDLLWQLDCVFALALGLTFIVAAVGLLKLTRLRAPRLTVLTACFLVPGAIGMAMHSVFWNVIYGVMSRTGEFPAMAVMISKSNYYPPFDFALALVILALTLGLILNAVTLWRSRVVGWWAALLVLIFPLNDLFGSNHGWIYSTVDLLWFVGWGAAALALLRHREQPLDHPDEPATVGALHQSSPRFAHDRPASTV
jgi:hypothetical protein